MPPVKLPFEDFLKRYREWKTNEWPRIVGRIALEVWDENFQNGGFTDKVFIPWKPRKNDTENRGRKHGDGGRQSGRAILIKSGALRRSLRVKYTGPTMVRWAAGSQDVPYAEIHNEGGRVETTQNVKAHTRRHFETDEVSGARAKKARFVKITTGTSQVKAHARKLNYTMPRRHFMGASAKLMDRLSREFFRHINKLWRA